MTDRAAITAAAERTFGHVRRTPVLDIGADGFASGSIGALTLKLELFQHTGSFKARGAFNFVLSHDIGPAGLTAASGGNHGQAVAFVAAALGVPASIYVPEVCSPVKRERIAAYGADVQVGGALYADAQQACTSDAVKTGALLVHPYDAEAVVAGQGTVGMELDAQAPGLDTVIVATGGGGLIGGIAAWYANSATKVISVEPDQSCCLAAALKAGKPVDVEVAGVAADSLGARRIGQLAFDIASQHVEAAVTVSDDAIAQAQNLLWDRARIVAEPGGATALAAVLSGAYVPKPGERVGIVVCGGNVDLAAFAAR